MDIRINEVLAKDGTEIIEIIKDEQAFRMNSLYRPVAEAEKFAEQFSEWSERDVLCIFGYGNGIIPEAIRKVFKGTIIFYEPCKEAEEYLRLKNRCVVSAEGAQTYYLQSVSDKGKLISLLENVITYSNYRNVQCVSLPRYRDIFPEEYAYFFDCIQYRVRALKANIASAKYLGQKAVDNNIMNMLFLPDGYCGDGLCDRFPADMPAIIVSAGPSLEKNISVLRKAKGHALIVCVDSAIPYLMKCDIIPDYIITIDSNKSLTLFDDSRVQKIPVIATFESNYKVLEHLKQPEVIFVSTENTYIQALYKSAGHSIVRLKSGGSVATMAFSVCQYWGFKTIILVGQDLALTDLKMYAGGGELGAEMLDNESLRAMGKELLEVEGIDGNLLYTYADYYSYLKWFEQVIEQNPELTVVDATEGGAKIAGTLIMTLGEALNTYGSERNYQDVILHVHKGLAPAFNAQQRLEVKSVITGSSIKLKSLELRLKDVIKKVEKCVDDMRHNKDIEKYLFDVDYEIREVCSMYDEMEEGYLVQRQIDATELEHFLQIFENADNEAKLEQYLRIKDYFECLLRAISIVSEKWECVSDALV